MSAKPTYNELLEKVEQLESLLKSNVSENTDTTDRSDLYKTLFYHMLYEVHIWKLVRDELGNIKTWRLIDANPAALNNWEKKLPELRGKTTDEIFNTTATDTFMPIVQKIFDEKKPHLWESYFSGTDQTLQMVSVPLGEIFISCGVDISHIKRINHKLSEYQHRLSVATESANIGIWEYDLTTQTLIWDQSMYQIYGLEPSTADIPYSSWVNGVHEDDIEQATMELDAAIASAGRFKSEFRIVRKDNSEIRYIEAGATTITTAEGKPIKMIGVNIDITDRKQAELEIQGTRNRLAIATSSANIGVWEYDVNANKLIWDESMFHIYGVAPSDHEISFNTWTNNIHKDDIGRVTLELEVSIVKEADFNCEFRIVSQDTGRTKYIVARASFHKGEGGVIRKLIGVNIDITDQKKAEQQIEFLAYFDTLTGLPNRSMITDRLAQSIARSERQKGYNALIFIDIDDFKKLNDSAGHAIGDELLIAFATRLKAKIRKGDTFGRFGGDEFIVILNNLDEQEDVAARSAELFAMKLVESIRDPFKLSIVLQQTTASFGVSLFTGESSLSDVLRQADLAMYKAKESGRNAVHFFDPVMQKRILKRVLLEKDLLNAIEKEKFEVHYQVQKNDAGRIIGAEALLRWNHPEKGFISPRTFIPIVEETGQIKQVGRWVLKKACSDLKQFISRHVDDTFVLSINVSAIQVHDDDFVDTIAQDVADIGIDPSQIKIELTESTLLSDTKGTMQKMLALKAIGIKFSLDDFGTGYSSLSRLKQLPIDELKIDQSFVHDIIDDEHSQAISKSVIALSKSLDLKVIAEGVETDDQKARLKDMGCRAYQGYLLGRPLPLDEFLTLLQHAS